MLAVLILIILVLSFIGFDFWILRRNFSGIKYRALIEKYAEKFKVEPELLAAIIYVESRFNKNSKSYRGAMGLMQLMPETAFWIAGELKHDGFDLNDLNDPETNIKFGSWYFSYLHEKFNGDLIKTVAAYNAGETNVRRWIDNGWQGGIKEKLPFAETDNFVRRVISTKRYYNNKIIS